VLPVTMMWEMRSELPQNFHMAFVSTVEQTKKHTTHQPRNVLHVTRQVKRSKQGLPMIHALPAPISLQHHKHGKRPLMPRVSREAPVFHVLLLLTMVKLLTEVLAHASARQDGVGTLVR